MLDLPVLLVDEEPMVRSLIRIILSKHGLQILEDRSGSRALSTIKRLEGAISLLVSDYSTSDIDGATLTSRVKVLFPAIPVLLLSGGGHSGDSLPGDAFLLKPFVPTQLLDATRHLLALRENQCA